MQVTGQLAEMSDAISAGIRIFGTSKFCRKVVEGQYETRFNRAVFDVQVGALSNNAVRRQALENPDLFQGAYEAASSDNAFLRSVESTTKTSEATRTRFNIFYAQVNRIFNENIEIPLIDEV